MASEPTKKIHELRLLAVVLLLITALAEMFLVRTLYYTVGEVAQLLHGLLVLLNVPLFVIALWRPRIGLWGIVVLSALLIPWQTWQCRKCAVLHEEVVGLIRHLEETKERDGRYPAELNGYGFKATWVRPQVRYQQDGAGFRLSYFMDNPGTSYWYRSDTGFGYYGD